MIKTFDRALVCATAAHAQTGQRRKFTGEPYIVHPIDVAMILSRFGITDEDTLVAALLHDVVEDTDTTLDDVKEAFGARVAQLVDQVSNKPGEDFTDRLARLGSADWQAQAIKCADITSNCLPLPDLSPAYAKSYFPRKAREVAMLGRAPVGLARMATDATRLDRLVIS